MSKILLLFILITVSFSKIMQSNTCKGCHPLIASEFENSMHKKTSIYSDKLHKKIWDIHPNRKKEQYTCAKCHTPTDLELLEKLKNNKKAMPTNNIQAKEGISCVYCHSIKDIKHNKTMNENILNEKEKLFFSANVKKREESEVSFKEKSSLLGMFKSKVGSPFHKIDYTNNGFYNANVCMGCHSHLKNKNSVDLCRADLNKIKDERTNCISCHMPKIKGSLSTIKITKKHTFHGFAGAHNNVSMLSKYVKIKLHKKENSFNITIKNEAAHDLFLQPLRVAKLKVNILRKNKKISLKTITFEKIFAKDNKISSPWEATSILKNSMLKANETQSIRYDYKLKKKDFVEVSLVYYLISQKMSKKLGLEKDILSKPKVLKSLTIEVR